MKRAFDYLGFKYIDILVHPVRFLDDIMFSFYSNDDDIYSLFLRLAVPESIFYREAGFIQSSRVNKKTKLTQYINTVLFGQTDDDKVLIQNGKLVNSLILVMKSKMNLLKTIILDSNHTPMLLQILVF